MSDSPAEKSEFMLLFRNTQLEKRLPADAMKEAMTRINEWLARWAAQGGITGGQPLGNFEARLDHHAAAAAHFGKAFRLAETKSEQAFLTGCLSECEAHSPRDS